jgi:hypothetical protein
VRIAPCQQANLDLQAAKAAWLADQTALIKAREKLKKAQDHGTPHQIAKARKKVKKLKKEIKADQAAIDAAQAQQDAAC